MELYACNVNSKVISYKIEVILGILFAFFLNSNIELFFHGFIVKRISSICFQLTHYHMIEM